MPGTAARSRAVKNDARPVDKGVLRSRGRDGGSATQESSDLHDRPGGAGEFICTPLTMAGAWRRCEVLSLEPLANAVLACFANLSPKAWLMLGPAAPRTRSGWVRLHKEGEARHERPVADAMERRSPGHRAGVDRRVRTVRQGRSGGPLDHVR